MSVINLLNEKGNVSPAVRTAIKNAAVAKYLSDVTSVAQVNAKGGYSIRVGEDQNGTPIYFNVACTVSNADPFAEKVKVKKAEPEELNITIE